MHGNSDRERRGRHECVRDWRTAALIDESEEDGTLAAGRAPRPAGGDFLYRVVLSFLLAILVFAAFWPGLQAYFVIIDDAEHVFANPMVLSGLNANSVRWAFENTDVTSNWHPITWLSHMLDVEMFGQAALGHHLTSIVIHSVDAVLLFAVLRRATGALWPSFLAAVLFAVHPLRVESVVWIAERKDALSTLFGLLSTVAYFRYVRTPSVGRYALVAFGLALSLMTKPTLVTLPVLFLLLDYWPLRRWAWTDGASFDWKGAFALGVEKLPWLGVSGASAVVTIFSQKSALAGGVDVTLPERLSNAVVSYAIYLGNFVWPTDLSPFYAHPNLPGGVPWSVLEVVASALVLLAITTFVFRSRSEYLQMGWMWYVVAMLPMIGLLQAGLQARADRYTYVPSIGLSIAVAWGTWHMVEPWLQRRVTRALACGVAAFAVVSLTAASYVQSQHWHDSTTMLKRSLRYSPNSAFIHTNIGYYLAWSDDLNGGLQHLERALLIDPSFNPAHTTAAGFLAQAGRYDEAIAHYQAILDLRPDDPSASKSMFDVRMQKAQSAAGEQSPP